MSSIVKTQTQALINEITKTPEYTDFVSLRNAIIQDKETYEKVNSYRRRLFELQCYQATSDGDQYEAITALNRENEQLFSKPAVGDFIKAELKLTKLISSVFDTITQGINIDLSFLD
ncbi:MAG: uncharacterized protein K0R15_44 [Clostridiales bacterium]|jgi:cell fate (sporulation/competence/biofilm development) regulator YlbF (YheA/YmcA/DUF963 family)|nr:uncharacterized protein [Clostridiales bacterium]